MKSAAILSLASATALLLAASSPIASATRSSNVVVDSDRSTARHLHVRMFYEPNKMSIRNANGATGDGRFSVNGPCGGVNAFSTDPTRIATVKDGAEISLKVVSVQCCESEVVSCLWTFAHPHPRSRPLHPSISNTTVATSLLPTNFGLRSSAASLETRTR